MYFSSIFNVTRESITKYGALDIRLDEDMPVFIDPFLLFASDKEEYKTLHDLIIDYLIFLRTKSTISSNDIGTLKSLYCFPEVKQNWMGLSEGGNEGQGLGMGFAKNSMRGFLVFFKILGVIQLPFQLI